MELTSPRTKTLWLSGILVCLIAVAWFFSTYGSLTLDKHTAESPSRPVIQVTSQKPADEKPLIGEAILQGYAATNSTVQQDLTLVSHVLENFALLVKGADPLPLGANEEIAAALRGRNRIQFRFVPDTSPIFNAKGQIVDRWSTPLYFHAVSRDRLEIRSAGPDKTMWTPDDVQRQSDGTFLSPDALQAPSLLDESLSHRNRPRK